MSAGVAPPSAAPASSSPSPPPQRPGPGITGQTLKVDSSASDADWYDGDRASISTSMTSAVTEYRFDHGRRYHAFAENAYWLPNDDIEIERLDIQHHVWRLSLQGKLHLAPLDVATIKDVVDVGTGTGLWALDFAEAHPKVNVLGTDLSPIQPPYTPPNCSFLIDNAESDWVFDTQFDYVHSRMLILGIKDWPRYFRQTWDNLRPGGWMEVKEPQFPIVVADDSDVRPDSPLMALSQYIREAAAVAGIDTMIVHEFRRMLEAQGFVNINVEPVKWPVGPWPKGENEKNIGRWMVPDTKEFISPAAHKLFQTHLGWTNERVEEFLLEVRKDIDHRPRHYYWSLYVVYAQKPETPAGPGTDAAAAKADTDPTMTNVTSGQTNGAPVTAIDGEIHSTMDTTINPTPATTTTAAPLGTASTQGAKTDGEMDTEIYSKTEATTGPTPGAQIDTDGAMDTKIHSTLDTTTIPVPATATATATATAPDEASKTVSDAAMNAKRGEEMDTS